MADSAKLLAQLKTKYSNKLDLSLERISNLLEKLDNPHMKLPRVIHVAGANGKESVIAFIEAILYASGRSVHTYRSRHLVRFNERINLAEMSGATPISDDVLVDALSRVKKANGRKALTFFEATTCAAFLAFSEAPADVLLISSGQGGGLDPTNVLEHKDLTVITPASMDKAPLLGETMAEIALEFSGVMRPKTPCVVGPQAPDASVVIENYAENIGAHSYAAGTNWMTYEQHGRLVYQDDEALIDLQLPRLTGPNQIGNAGMAIAAVRKLSCYDITEEDIDAGLQSARIQAQLQPITDEGLLSHLYEGSEIWLDSGQTKDDALSLGQAMADFEERVSCPLHLISAMKRKADAESFFAPFEGLVEFVATIPVPDSENLHSPSELASIAREAFLNAAPQAGLEEALQTCRSVSNGPVRVLICGAHALAGHVLSRVSEESN